MAKLYRHKIHGWQLNYTLYYPDGTERIRYRTLRRKGEAGDLLEEAERLERKCIRGELSRQDALRCQRLGLISTDDAAALYGRAVEVPALGELAETFLRRSRPQCRDKTRRVNAQRINTLLEHFGRDARADSITRDNVLDYRLHRLSCRSRIYAEPEEGRAHEAPRVGPATVNKEVIKLAQVLDLAVAMGAIPENPARGIAPLPDGLGRLPRALSREEIARLLAAARTCAGHLGGMLPQVIQAYLYTGMRREELLRQRWRDVDLERRAITIQGDPEGAWTTKSRQARVVGIGQRLLPVIEALPRQGVHLFGGDAPLCGPDSMSRVFRLLRDRAGLPGDITLHSLRHTYITHLLDRGVPLRRVQYLAGHARITTTERYTHLLPTPEIAEDRLDF